MRVLWFFAVLCGASLAVLAAGSERLPIGEFTAVRLNPAPTIDGKMAPGEWDRAFATSGLIVPFDHQMQEAETTMYLGYDAARFFFLMRCRRGNNEWKLWKSSRSNDEYDFGEPSVEIWVTPPALVPETYQNIINTYPAVFDQKFIPSRGYASLGWKANWQVGVSEDAQGYLIEASVPIKDFGFESVKDGDVWRFLLCRNAPGTRPRSQASWSITQGFTEIPQHPLVRFADNVPAVQLLGVLSVFTGAYRFPMAITAPAKTGAEVDVTLRFMQGKTPSETDVIAKKTLTLKAGERQEFTFDGAIPDGWKSGNFAITAVTKDGTPLFNQTFPFTVNGFTPQTPAQPAEAKVEELALRVMYGPETNNILVKADMLEFPRRGEVAGGTVKVLDPGNKRILKQTTLGAFRESYASAQISMQGEQVPVKDTTKIAYVQAQIDAVTKENEQLAKQGKPLKPVPQLPVFTPRTVMIECTLTDKAGNALVTNTKNVDLLRYNFKWMNNTVGITDEVIPPWTPVQVQGSRVHVWNRTTDLDGLGLAKGLVNGGVNQLKAAMRLVAVVDGKEQPITATAPAVTRQVPNAVDFAGTAFGAGLALSAKTRVEFDGFTLVNLTIAPQAATAKVDRLTLEISLPEDEATHYCTTAGGWAAVHDVTPASWNSLQTASGTLANDFVPYIWLTNSDRGFMWMADSDKGWMTDLDRAHPTQELVRTDGQVVLRLHFIEVPTELKTATTLTFGYQAFPSRPLPNGWRAILCAGSAPTPDTRNTYFWFDGDWAVLWPYYCSPYPWNIEKSRGLFARYPINTTHRPAVGSIAHSIGRYRDYDGNQFPELAVDWATTPGQVGNSDVTQSKGPIDFRLYHYQQWVQEARFRALYIDENYLSSEDNWLTGNAYFRADGRLQQGYSYLGLREYYKRMMTMFYQNNAPRPNLWMHITSGAAYYAWFGDVFFEGENVEPTNLEYDYIEVLPASRMRAIGSSVCAGGVISMMCQSLRHATQWTDKHNHQFVGWVMAHDIIPEQVPQYPILMQEGRLYADDVTFYGYWKKDAPARTRSKNCLVSTHATKGRALLWVVNTTRADQQVVVDVDLAKLGLDPKRTVAFNAETGEVIAFTGKAFTVPVLQRDFTAVHLLERAQLKNGETLVATFESSTRADEAFGCDVFGAQQRNDAVARCAGKTGMGLNTANGVNFWSHLHLTEAEGRIAFAGLVNENAAGPLVQVGPLTAFMVQGKTPAVVLEYKPGMKDAKIERAESPALTPGWHDCVLAWKNGTAVLTIDGAKVGTVPVGVLGIANGTGKAMLNSTPVVLGGRNGLLAIDDLRCSRIAGW